MLPAAIFQFQETVWDYYKDHGRHDLSWRRSDHGTFDPYKILVSEIMLQQTQVSRVIPKYHAFLEQFPMLQDLAQAELSDVLKAWSGLGYNRRAKFLWQAAGVIAQEHRGLFPKTLEELARLPGIGLHTAGAIVAYSFNRPVVFIETNIRTVFLHHFFTGQGGVTDKQLTEYVLATLPEQELTREWYWALMDYGSYLKQQVGNVSRAAAGYTKQSRFEGSKRQIRGQVLRLLGGSPVSEVGLSTAVSDERLPSILMQLAAEGLIHEQDGKFHLGA